MNYYLPSHFTHRLLMICPVSIAGNTRIANDILGTKIQGAFYSTAQLGENVVSNICRPFPPWNLSMPWNYFENSLTVYLSKAYVSYHCLFLSALTDMSSAATPTPNQHAPQVKPLHLSFENKAPDYKDMV